MSSIPTHRLLPTLIVALLGAATAHALPGDLDPDFGDGGRLRWPVFEQRAVARYTGGSVVVEARNDLRRYTANGELDPTFGTGGIVVLGRVPRVLLTLPDGKLIVGLRLTTGDDDEIRLERRDVDGSLDATFGAGGSVEIEAPGVLAAIARQPSDGAIVIAGQVDNPDGVFVARFTADGILDPTFSGGSVQHTLPSSPGRVSLVVQSTGRIVVGTENDGLIGLATDGSLDPAFGVGGVAGGEEVWSLALAPDDTLVMSGERNGDLLVKLLANGTRDPSFGTAGVVVDDGVVTVQPNGKIVVADGSLARRYLGDGTVDPTFTVGAGVQNTNTRTLLAQDDGRIVVAGGDGHANMITILANTCGDDTLEAGEDCDDGNLDDGDGCDAHCCVADADGDGRCDAIDPCTSGAPLQKASIKVAGRGARKLGIAGTIQMPAAAILALDPSVHGFRYRVEGTDHIVRDYTVPPGVYDPVSRVGWVLAGSPERPRWIWKSPNTSNAFALTQVELRDKSNASGGLLQVKISGKFVQGANGGEDDFFDFTRAGAVPPVLTLVADAPTAETGHCGSASFPGPAPLPRCTVKLAIQLACK